MNFWNLYYLTKSSLLFCLHDLFVNHLSFNTDPDLFNLQVQQRLNSIEWNFYTKAEDLSCKQFTTTLYLHVWSGGYLMVKANLNQMTMRVDQIVFNMFGQFSEFYNSAWECLECCPSLTSFWLQSRVHTRVVYRLNFNVPLPPPLSLQTWKSWNLDHLYQP